MCIVPTVPTRLIKYFSDNFDTRGQHTKFSHVLVPRIIEGLGKRFEACLLSRKCCCFDLPFGAKAGWRATSIIPSAIVTIVR